MEGKKDLVCKLKESQHGLKQSPRTWYQNFDTYIFGLGFTWSKDDHYAYFKLVEDHCHLIEAWDLVEFLSGRNPIGKKWVFKNKLNVEGKVEKLVEKGYSQVEGINFGHIFSPIAK